jgi:hypothetical protein
MAPDSAAKTTTTAPKFPAVYFIVLPPVYIRKILTANGHELLP